MSYDSAYTARPSRPPASRGEYQPPTPYLRPGSHPNAPPKEDAMSFATMTMQDRRAWLWAWLDQHGPATRHEVVTAAGCEPKHMDPIASDLRKRGSVTSYVGEDGKTRWKAVAVEAAQEEAQTVEGDGSGEELPPVSDDEQIADPKYSRPPKLRKVEEIPSSIQRIAVSGDGCLMLWTADRLIDLDNHETRQLLRLLQTNQRVIESA